VKLYRSSVASRALLFVASAFFFRIGGVCAQATSAGAIATPPIHEVTDEVGRTVRVPVNPQRIISLAPSLTETLYALHLEDRLVADTVYCDYPPDAQKKPKVGGVIDPNLEEIAALQPDLVLMTKGANRLETVRALDALGIPSYATDPHNVDQIISSTRKLAAILNIPETGRAVSEDLQARLEKLRSMLKAVPPKRVFFVVWTEPLISVGKDTFIADALRRAGATSIVESGQDWPQISLEEVARLQPDYLVFAASHTDMGERNFEELKDRAGWRILDAVHNRRFAVISDAVIRPAPRIVSAIEELARQLHPEAFRQTPGPEEASPLAGTNTGGRIRSRPIAWRGENTECSEESQCVR
jgi:iron complex transport system substrate-binding protein